MKQLILTAILYIISVNAFAALSAQEQRLVSLMTSGDLKELKAASQQIAQTNLSNTEVLDISAEILLHKYKYAYSFEIDTLAWLARGLGASKNSRYYSVLKTVASDSNDKKLSSHAAKALKMLSPSSENQYLLGSTKLPDGIYPIKTQKEQDDELLEMILSGNLSDLKNAAKQIIASNNQSQQLTDAAAEVLLNLYPNEFEYQQDTLGWIAKALGENKSGRYYDVLTQVSKANSKALKKYSKKALKAHGKAMGDQYKMGMTSLKTKEYI